MCGAKSQNPRRQMSPCTMDWETGQGGGRTRGLNPDKALPSLGRWKKRV